MKSDRAKELASALLGNPWVEDGVRSTLSYLLRRWDAEDLKDAKPEPLTPEEEFDRYF